MSRALRVGLLAGESSGDLLGRSLMQALAAQSPGFRIGDAQFDGVEYLGVGGPGMVEAGLEEVADFQQLAINGFVDPIKRLPSLLKLLRELTDELAKRVDVFVGVDFNVFNLLLEGRLKRRGVPTVHYVSPSVYAWRRGRIRRMAKSCSRVLCLYPFEPELYLSAGVDAVFVGHPLADEIAPGQEDALRAESRARLGLAPDEPVLAVLPGSRGSEIDLMMPAFARACRLIVDAKPGLRLLVPSTSQAHADRVRQHLLAEAPELADALLSELGGGRRALAACDVGLVKSGTSTLEAMLLRRPMVVSYRLGRVTASLLRPFVRTPYFALPNILAGEALVPEFIQDDATPEALAGAVLAEWSDDRSALLKRFAELHAQLARDAGVRAAEAVLGLVAEEHTA